MKLSETIRDDGLRVITARVPSKRVHVEISGLVGSAYDPDHKRGLFHYFEHMAFKGSHRRTVEEIRAFTRRNLLSSNASTGRLMTSYYGEAVYKKGHLLCELLCDMYCNSIFPAEEIEREKEVVLNEIARDSDDDNRVAYCTLWGALWRENPLRIFGVGTPEGVQSVTRDDLLETKANWYVPSNTTAIAVGNIHHETFLAELNEHFQGVDRHVEHTVWSDEYHELPIKSEVLVERPERKKATIVFGCKFPQFVDERDRMIVRFLEHILVRGTDSLLWRELREKRGLAYALSGGVSSTYPLGSYFYVYVETLPNRVDEVRGLVPGTLFKSLPDTRSFQSTREYIYDWYTLGFEQDLGGLCALVDDAIRNGSQLKKLERYYERQCRLISSISIDEVEQLRAETLKSEKFTTVIVRPT